MPGIELLSPAGDMSALIAAVENGADAVYLGAKDLNARRGAGNFDADELKYAVKYCHERLISVHVTVNTVVKQSELNALENIARQIADAGADAAIVQDFGAARALKHMLPSLKLHASTQMAIHNAQGCAWAKQNGFERVVLARELTYGEIRECAATGVEIEAFCHGALCVACSGQCLFSSVVGGRSGNRGACAQPCRLPYKLISPFGETEGYLLSTKDLMTLDSLDSLIRAGVSSLKIEGRLKRPEYVAIVTRAYRRALDGAPVTRADIAELMQIYNRGGFTPGYAPGVHDGELISKARPNHAGLKIGAAARGRVTLDAPALMADELVIRSNNGEDTPVKLAGGAGESVICPVKTSGDVYRLVSEAQLARARESFRESAKRAPIRMRLCARAGETIKWEASDGARRAAGEGADIALQSRKQVSEAELHARIRAQLEKTGGTQYIMERVDIDAPADVFISAAVLNQIRRDAADAISSARALSFRTCDARIRPLEPEPEIAEYAPVTPRLVAESARVNALLRARAAGADEIVFAPGDLRAEALDGARRALGKFFIALPPVAPARALDALNEWAAANAQAVAGVYITNIGQLALKWQGETRFDYALNITNERALYALNAQASVYAPSIELTAREINELGGRKELLVYGALPLMHLRHCPLNASLNGGAHAECARCDGAAESIGACALIDRKRARFPLSRTRTQYGCVIHINNCVPVMPLKRLNQLPQADGWRMRFTNEDDARVSAVTRMYRRAADGEDIKYDLDQFETDRGEYTTGHYFRGVE